MRPTQPRDSRNRPISARRGPDDIRRFKVDATDIVPDKPLTLIDFIASKLPERKRSAIKDMLRHGSVMVDGQLTATATAPLAQGQQVDLNLTREFTVLNHRRLSIVYEDDDIIVVNKGYGLLSVGAPDTPRNIETAYSILREYLKRKDPRNKIFVVHRLDRDTSGVMMFAKTPEAKEAMQHNWNNMVLERRYVCVVEGAPEPAEGDVRSYLAENSRFEVYSTDNPEEGRIAVTRYRTLGTRGQYSLLEVSLDTGRKNQIRVHMKDLGTPIVGDRKYGAKTGPIHRLALHAMTLRFAHPSTRRDMNFSSPIPPSFLKLAPAK